MSTASNLFAGQRVVVMGGSSGIGEAAASAFAGDGAEVVVTGRDRERLDAAVARIGGRATGRRLDAADPAALAAFFAGEGTVDHLIVAVSGAAGSGPFAQLDLAELATGFRGSSRSQSSAGARALTSWVSRSSTGSSEPSVADQELAGARSGSSPASSVRSSSDPAAGGVPVPSNEAAAAVSWPLAPSGRKPGAWVMARRSAAGRAVDSPAASRAYDSGGRRSVWAALLTRMSSGRPSARNWSVSSMTWRGSRRSMATTVSRSHQCSLPSAARKRRTVSCGKRLVTISSAPSRNIIRASWKPILTRPPVSSARRPRRSVVRARRALLSAAQSGQSRW
ncbi:short subunit dehydrogenase [Streptomyces sp. 1114.5]|nr:short subunit dehydrogenase [Streptomyces sp. 1114.5]